MWQHVLTHVLVCKIIKAETAELWWFTFQSFAMALFIQIILQIRSLKNLCIDFTIILVFLHSNVIIYKFYVGVRILIVLWMGWMLFNDTLAQFRPFGVLNCFMNEVW